MHMGDGKWPELGIDLPIQDAWSHGRNGRFQRHGTWMTRDDFLLVDRVQTNQLVECSSSQTAYHRLGFTLKDPGHHHFRLWKLIWTKPDDCQGLCWFTGGYKYHTKLLMMYRYVSKNHDDRDFSATPRSHKLISTSKSRASRSAEVSNYKKCTAIGPQQKFCL